MKKEEIIATVVLKRPAYMTIKGRKEIANWLRRQAYQLEKNAGKLADNYTARYIKG